MDLTTIDLHPHIKAVVDVRTVLMIVVVTVAVTEEDITGIGIVIEIGDKTDREIQAGEVEVGVVDEAVGVVLVAVIPPEIEGSNGTVHHSSSGSCLMFGNGPMSIKMYE